MAGQLEVADAHLLVGTQLAAVGDSRAFEQVLQRRPLGGGERLVEAAEGAKVDARDHEQAAGLSVLVLDLELVADLEVGVLGIAGWTRGGGLLVGVLETTGDVNAIVAALTGGLDVRDAGTDV